MILTVQIKNWIYRCCILLAVLSGSTVAFGQCSDNTACNYDTSATATDSSTCIYPGCTDVTACNYDSTAGCSDNSCQFPGCTDPLACNYDATAICDDGLCSFPSCTEPSACNFDSTAICDDGSCSFPGCTDSTACNFDPSAACEGVCLTADACGECGGNGIAGCMDPSACNFDSSATCEGICNYGQNTLLNFNTDATGTVIYNDSSLIHGVYQFVYQAINGCDSIVTVVVTDSLAEGCLIEEACNYDPTVGVNIDSLCVLPNGCTDMSACNYDSTATCDDGSCLSLDACNVCGGDGISGCMDVNACNYDATATCDNGACVLPNGCTDIMACNYDSAATCDNGSCILPDGCTDMTACNYDSLATCDNGSCQYFGCTDIFACNYDSTASCDDGSCIAHPSSSLTIVIPADADSILYEGYLFSVAGNYFLVFPDSAGGIACDSIVNVIVLDSAITGCTDITACNYEAFAGISDDSLCTYPGCTDSLACNYDANAVCGDLNLCTSAGCTDNAACNYNPFAACNDGSCILPDGCTDIAACNYDSLATCNDGSCSYPGCTDAAACNYDAVALCDNGLCVLPDGCTDVTACNYDSTASCDNGSCEYPNGCSDVTACNYDASVTCGDLNSCVYSGCLDPAASNFMTAGCNDTCVYVVSTCSDLNLTFDQGLCFDDGTGTGVYGPLVTLLFNYTGDCTVSTVTIDGGTPIDVTQFNLANDSIISAGIVIAGTSSTYSFTLSDGTVSADFTVDANDCSGDPTICDCAGNVHTIAVTSWIGDTYEDSGVYTWAGQFVDFNCATWGYDCGDIAGAPSEDPYDVCGGNLPPASDTVALTGFGCGLAVVELPSMTTISVFPNPTNGRLNIVTSGAYENRVVRIFDQTGNLVFTERRAMSPGVAEMLDLSFLPAGTYHVQLVGSKEVQNTSVILQR